MAALAEGAAQMYAGRAQEPLQPLREPSPAHVWQRRRLPQPFSVGVKRALLMQQAQIHSCSVRERASVSRCCARSLHNTTLN